MADLRTLDVNVARIVGWYALPPGWIQGPLVVTPDGQYVEVPRYSTDPAALPEMLAWLIERDPGIKLESAWWSSNPSVTWSASAPTKRRVEAATLFEAVARLVVACAEAKP